MKTVDKHGTFVETLEGSSEQAQAIARQLRDLIIDLYPNVVEVPWPKQSITGYGVGPKKMSEHFCYIGVFKEHVNLGFYYGADLPDPEGLLDGTGKKLRHVRIEEQEKLKHVALRQLILDSVAERKRSLGLG